jgi:REP element-mobilizing transposase RayT
LQERRAMMQQVELLEPGKYYHIYNCGIDGTNLFHEKEDYDRFLKLIEKYVLPVCEIYAWVLMKNHFHILVKIRENRVYKYSNDSGIFDKERFNDIKWETRELLLDQTLTGPADAVRFERPLFNLSASDEGGPDSVKRKPQAHLHFSHLFNAYAKYFNIRHKRHGSLFERQFNRKLINNMRYFKAVVIYIHQNPVHHRFCDHVLDYGWSSYLTFISVKPTNLSRDEVLGWFDGRANFKLLHKHRIDVEDIERFLDL